MAETPIITKDDTNNQYLLFDGMIVVDVPNGTMSISADLSVSPIKAKYAGVSANHTAIGQHSIIGVNSLTAVTITLQSSLITQQGFQITIKDESGAASTNPITIVTQGTEKIDGGDTKVIDTDYGVIRLYSNGSNLFLW